MSSIWHDLRYGVRMLARSPGFTIVAVLTLALGIGANTAVFSLFEQLMLQTLPVNDPRQLVLIEASGRSPGMESRDNRHTVHSYPTYLDLKERSTVFAGVLARTGVPVALVHGEQSERVDGELVSGNFFEVLGVGPVLGRLFSEEDDRVDGGHPVVVLSHGFWMRRFGGDEKILNQKVGVNGHPMTVIGVAAPRFRGVISGRAPDLYVPLAMRRQTLSNLVLNPRFPERAIRYLSVMARLKPGVTLERAQSVTQGVFRGILEEELAEFGARGIRDPERFLSRKISLVPALQGIHSLREQIEAPLISVMVLVGVVLLIACMNVASLLLARVTARSREVAIRVALGAGRRRLAGQWLVESMILASLGGLAGLVVAYWTTDLLVWLTPGGEGGDLVSRLDEQVLAFNFILAALTGLIFGIAPALQAASADVAPGLKDQSASAGETRRHTRFRQVTVVMQVALSMLLLVAAGLFARSLYNLKNLDPGFRTTNLLSFALDPQLSGYSQERGVVFYRDLLDRLRRLPGVRDAGAALIPLLSNSSMATSITVEGYQAKEGESAGSSRNVVTPHYFRTIGIPVVLGRGFTERDAFGAPKAAVVNEAFVEKYFGGENPIGRHLGFGRADDVNLDIEIVGVVKNQKNASLREKDKTFVYTPYTQMDQLLPLSFYLWTSGQEAALGSDVRRLVSQLAPNLPVFQMKTVAAVRDDSIQIERAVATLAGGFAGLSIVLAVVGLYGLVAYSVTRRTREIGIRVALGALPGDVYRIVLKQTLLYLLLGLVIGTPAALALGRYVESQLFGLTANDPLVISLSAVVLGAAVLAAAFVPARRATKIDPVVALRYE